MKSEANTTNGIIQQEENEDEGRKKNILVLCMFSKRDRDSFQDVPFRIC